MAGGVKIPCAAQMLLFGRLRHHAEPDCSAPRSANTKPNALSMSRWRGQSEVGCERLGLQTWDDAGLEAELDRMVAARARRAGR